MKEYWERFKSELKLTFYKYNAFFSPYFAYGSWWILDDYCKFKSYKEAVEYSKKNNSLKFHIVDEYNADKDYKEYWNE